MKTKVIIRLLSVMNIKLIIFSGLVTASLGAVIGLATADMSRGEVKPIKVVNSQLERDLSYKHYAVIGAIIGSLVGMGQECVRELKYAKE